MRIEDMTLAQINEELDTLNKEIEEVEDKISKMEDELDLLEQRKSRLSGRCDELEDRQYELEEEENRPELTEDEEGIIETLLGNAPLSGTEISSLEDMLESGRLDESRYQEIYNAHLATIHAHDDE